MNSKSNIERIREQLFTVLTVPLYPPSLGVIESEFDVAEGAKFERPNSFGNYKHTGGECLGVLGKDFRATQPSVLLDAFTECLADTDLDLSTLQYNEVQGGKKIRFKVQIGETKFRNQAKVGDVVKSNLVLQTGYDGYTATTFQLETYVLKCSNGMVGRDTTQSVKIKNTSGNVGKIALVCSDISNMIKRSGEFTELIKLYDHTKISKADVNEFVKYTLGCDPKEYNDLHVLKRKRIDELQSAIEVELSRNGNTAWGLLNAITFATNHIWADDSTRLDYLTNGGGLKINDKAQDFLNRLVNA